MNIWWTNVVQNLVYEVHMESFMNSHNFDELGRINSVHSLFMKVHELWWIIMNFHEVHEGLFHELWWIVMSLISLIIKFMVVR